MANLAVIDADNKGPSAPHGRNRSFRGNIGWIISAICLVLVVWRLDFGAFAEALKGFSWPLLVPALAGLAFGYSMRVLRWARMLRATGANVGFSTCVAPFLGSIALNNVLPLRAGDIIRATVFPAAINVPRTAAFSSIIIERLLDLLTLTLFLAVGATALSGDTLPEWLVNTAVVFAIAGGASLFGIIVFSGPLAGIVSRWASATEPNKMLRRILHVVATLLGGFRFMSAPKALAPVLLLSILAWIGESAAFYFVLIGFGFAATPVTAILVMAFVTLATLVPSSPGYIGPFHIAAITITMLLGVTRDAATSFAVVSHLMLWAPTTIAGALAMLIKPELFRSARQNS